MKIFSGRISRRKMLKIGSLSLSVNAIVVLVLAITMLGLGLAFTKGMFGKLAGKIEIPPPNIPATKGEPIVLPAEEVRWEKPTKDLAISVNIYNDDDDGYVMAGFECPNLAGMSTAITASNWVKADEFSPFKILLPKFASAPTASTTVCTIYKCYDANTAPTSCTSASAYVDQKQITLKV